MGKFPRDVLLQEVTARGQKLLDDPKLLNALLRDLCGDYQIEIEALLAARRADVPTSLQKERGLPLQALLAREVTKLRQNQGLAEEVARWAVESWAVALGRIQAAACATPAILTKPGTIARNRSFASQSQACVKLFRRWKTDLFDFSRRNPLLYFKPTATSTLEIRTPSFTELFARIAVQNRALNFPLYQVMPVSLPTEAPSGANRRFRYIQLKSGDLATDKSEGPLLRTLANLRNSARASRNELGLNSLYIGFALLHWVDPTQPSVINSAPLVLVPVDIERRRGKDEYQLKAIDDDIVVNPTLRAFLASARFNAPLHLPDLGDPDNGLVTFLAEVTRLATPLGWTVTESAVLRNFSFQTIRLGEDLDEAVEINLFPQAIRRLAGESLGVTGASNSPAAGDLDGQLHPRDVFQVLDADESQLQVLLESRSGSDMVIDGPPGTGKSQTIVNLIAQAVNDGRSVLFVSQKKAALEVVFNRLAEVGLDKLCLQVHSEKANKRAVLDELGAVYQSRRSSTSDLRRSDYDLLYDQRQRLNLVAKTLNEPLGGLSWSIQATHGKLLQLEETKNVSSRIRLAHSSALEVPEAEWQALESTVHEYVLARTELGQSPEAGPWRDIAPADHPGVRGEIQAVLRECQTLLENTQAFCVGVEQSFGVPLPQRRSEVLTFLKLATLLRDAPLLLANWFDPNASRAMRELVNKGRDLTERIEKSVEKLEAAGILPSIFQLEHGKVINQLGITDAVLSKYLVRPFPVWDKPARSTHTEAFVATYSAAHEAHGLHTHLTTRFGVASEPTLSQFQWFGQFLKCIAADSQPLEQWLDPELLGSVSQLAAEASERAVKYQQTTKKISETWDLGALKIQASALRQALHTQFRNIFQRLGAPYKNWTREMQQLWQGKGKVKRADLLGLLELLDAVEEQQHWFDKVHPQLQDMLGKWWSGLSTDFSSTLGALQVTKDIQGLFSPGQVPEPIRRMLVAQSISVSEANDLIRRITESSEALRRAHKLLQPLVRDSAWPQGTQIDTDINLAALHDFAEMLQAHANQLEATYDDVRQRVVDNNKQFPTTPEIGLLLGVAQSVVIADAELRSATNAYVQAFGPHFQSIRTDWDALEAALDFSARVREFLQNNYTLARDAWLQVVTKLCLPNRVSRLATECLALGEPLLRRFDTGLDHLQTFFLQPIRGLGTADVKLAPYPALNEWMQALLTAMEGLPAALRLAAAHLQASQAGMSDLIVEVDALPATEALWDITRKRFYQQWLEAAYQVRPEIKRLSIGSHRKLIDAFVSLDQELLVVQRQRTQLAWQRGLPALTNGVGDSQMGLLARELSKRRAHIALRQLFSKMPDLLLKLKPCVLMSPLSAAAYLPLSEFQSRFDLVIFDEASQVRPAFAGGAMLRGKQVVIAGDMQQLPPTDFFRATGGYEDDADDFDEGGPDQASEPAPLESILGEFLSLPGMHRSRLRWHYRSRNEALIQFSNQLYYHGDLVTFPSPIPGNQSQAVRLEQVNGVYDRGKTRQNQAEAQHVVKLIEQHLMEHGEQTSLGVITFSLAQEQAIRDELYAQLETGTGPLTNHIEWLDEDAQRLEPFFVKALERVQGDERDAIIISVGYGPDALGAVKQYFGPLATDGGERRLNVAVTRAKRQLTLVTSLRPTDIKISEATKAGVRDLRRYLEYCGSPSASVSSQTSSSRRDRPFEAAVEQALIEMGYTVNALVGMGSNRIDLAVVHPDRADEYLAGIQCDGHSYARIATARDRDRLRGQILRENMHWNLIQQWSSEWLNSPVRARTSLAKQLEDFRQAGTTLPKHAADGPIRQRLATLAAASAPAKPAPQGDWHEQLQTTQYQFYKAARKSSQTDFIGNPGHVAQCVQFVVQLEQPIHTELLFERVMDCYNLVLPKSEAWSRFFAGFQYALKHGHIIVKDEFAWSRQQTFLIVPRTPPPRIEPRKIDFVALEELGALAIQIVRMNYGIDRTALARLVSEIMGYKTLSKSRRQRINLAVDELARNGQLSVRGDSLLV